MAFAATVRAGPDPSPTLIDRALGHMYNCDFDGANATLVDTRYLRAYALSKESQLYARQLLAVDPPVVDAYLTRGSVEYVVSKMNWFFRMFVRFDQVEGSTLKGIEDLKLVVAGGRYYAPMAKALLALIYLREEQPEAALGLLRELERDFPGNRLFRAEVARVERQVAQGGAAGG